MCGCPPHLIEGASQIASQASTMAPFLGTVGAALLGGKLGQFLMKVRLYQRKKHEAVAG
jgi:hypothetical protein